MRIFVESLKRLYQKEKVTLEQVKERVQTGSISNDEYHYITGEVYEHV